MNLGNVLVTGGAGFIGSNLLKSIIPISSEIDVIDNLSSGNMENIENLLFNNYINFINCDIGDNEKISNSIRKSDSIFHFAAYPDVRTGFNDPVLPFNENFSKTLTLLEKIRQNGNVKNFIFASTSTVYGEAHQIPTPENYGPLLPISSYGASKLACEALVSAYCNTYGFQTKIFRLANIIGSNSRRGVIWDLIQKIKQNPKKLEILGNGFQSKSYLHIKDCIEGILTAMEDNSKIDIYNLGNVDSIDVFTIVKIIQESLKLTDIEIITIDKEGGRGWKGDVTKMNLSIEKIKSRGWHPSLNSFDSVKEVIKEMKSKNMT